MWTCYTPLGRTLLHISSSCSSHTNCASTAISPSPSLCADVCVCVCVCVCAMRCTEMKGRSVCDEVNKALSSHSDSAVSHKSLEIASTLSMITRSATGHFQSSLPSPPPILSSSTASIHQRSHKTQPSNVVRGSPPTPRRNRLGA